MRAKAFKPFRTVCKTCKHFGPSRFGSTVDTCQVGASRCPSASSVHGSVSVINKNGLVGFWCKTQGGFFRAYSHNRGFGEGPFFSKHEAIQFIINLAYDK